MQQVIERRALQIRMETVLRFKENLDSLRWSPYNLVFLDEVSFDNRDCWRTRGYAPRGQRATVRGVYRRLPRVSMLSFTMRTGWPTFQWWRGRLLSNRSLLPVPCSP